MSPRLLVCLDSTMPTYGMARLGCPSCIAAKSDLIQLGLVTVWEHVIVGLADSMRLACLRPSLSSLYATYDVKCASKNCQQRAHHLLHAYEGPRCRLLCDQAALVTSDPWSHALCDYMGLAR
eukprot:2791325-Amphidinium_carterae.2